MAGVAVGNESWQGKATTATFFTPRDCFFYQISTYIFAHFVLDFKMNPQIQKFSNLYNGTSPKTVHISYCKLMTFISFLAVITLMTFTAF